MKRLAYNYSCLMAVLPDDIRKEVLKAGKAIPDERLYDDGSGEKGREDNPHITIKYGIHTSDLAELLGIIKTFKPLRARLGKKSVFWNGDCIVIKISVQSQDLAKLNNLVSQKLACTNTYRDFKPHITLAYVKKDVKDPYWFLHYLSDDFDGIEIEIDKLMFTTADGKKYQIDLNKDVKMSDRISKIAKHIVSSKYGAELAKAVADTRQNIHGWKPEWQIPGFLIWTHPGKSRIIQATPFWRNDREIVVEVQEEDGTYIGGFNVPLKQTGVLEEDVVAYFKAMVYYWSRIMKIEGMP